MMQYIDVTKIEPHPDNPRKDLGDLTELAESIKANGILQNLTVVPWFSKISGVGADDPKQQEEMGYIVVIGHRRLAAAKLAGLTEVPCAIANMTQKEQIATMLLENMQRSDLTVYEQAQGFQLLLDFGESITNISEKTGFSETTVRRRVKLLELDHDKFKKSQQRGGTLQDYIELEKIEDLDLRNGVLEHIGTSNFNWKLQNAIDKEKNDKNKAKLIEQLEKFATQIEDSNGMRHFRVYYASNLEEVELPEDADTTEYFFVVSQYGYITLYTREEHHPEVNTAEAEKQKKLMERRTALKELTNRAHQLRSDFVREFSNTQASKNQVVIMEYAVRALVDQYRGFDGEEFVEILDIEEEWEFEDIAEQVTAQPVHHLLITTYCSLDTGGDYYNYWDCSHKENQDIDQAYNLLQKLGYEMSDEEKQLRDGTHDLFMINSQTDQ